MRLNLKNASITKIDQGKWRLVYDISKLNKPRLSPDARLYIEYLNLPEFIDDTWGAGNGDNRGRLELYCENLEEDNYDNNEYSSHTLIYASPLISFHAFTNGDPLKINNFKVRNNFLRDQIVMTLCIYDQYGQPYTKTSNRITNVLDYNSASFVAYQSKVNDKLNLESIKEDRTAQLLLITDATNNLLRVKEVAKNDMENKYQNLLTTINDYRIARSSNDEILKLKLNLFEKQISNLADFGHINYVLSLATTNQLLFSSSTLIKAKDEFAEAFYNYENAEFALQNNLRRVSEYQQNITTLIDNEKITFNPQRFLTGHINKTVQKEINKSVNFVIKDSGGLDVSAGTLAIDYFYNPTKDGVTPYNLTVSSGSVHVKSGAKLEIEPSALQAYVPSVFEWIAGKTDGTDRSSQQVFSAGYVISRIDVTTAGAGYTTAPDVAISAPPTGGTIQATATAILSFSVDSITITDAGTGYSAAPTVTVSAPPDGTTAVITATETSGVLSFTLDDPGSGYLTAPTITIPPPPPPPSGSPPGTQAIVSAVLQTTGKVQSITLTNAGLGYVNISPPTITIDPAPVGSGAVNAVATLVQVPNLYTTIKPKRFVFQINKDASSVNYQVKLRNDLFPSADFNQGDKIRLIGTQFGGKSPDNDIIVHVTGIEIAQDIPFAQTLEVNNDEPNFGSIDYSMIKDKTDGKYKNFVIGRNDTKNLKVGDKIEISHSQLQGLNATHDFEFEVEHVYEKERINDFDETSIYHQIQMETINDDPNPLIQIHNFANSGVQRNGYEIEIGSSDGKYMYRVINGGTDFRANDTIRILGEFFNGTNGPPATSDPNNPRIGGHDLLLQVHATDNADTVSAGAIVELREINDSKPGVATGSAWNSATPNAYAKTLFWNARCPEKIGIKVLTFNDNDQYYVKSTDIVYEPLNMVKNGDIFQILGNYFVDYSVSGVPASNADQVMNELIVVLNDIDPSNTTPPIKDKVRQSPNADMMITVSGTAVKEPAPVGKLRDLGFKITKEQGHYIPDVGKITSIASAGTHVVAADPQPTIQIELTQDLIDGIGKIDNDISLKEVEIDAAKTVLVPKKNIFVVEIDQSKLENLNMGLVLYDEIPEYTQASADAIIGNTYSRLVNNQFKRI